MGFDLEKIFAIQNEVIKRHIIENPDRFAFIASCIDLLFSKEISEEEWNLIPELNRKIFNLFLNDALSTLISATRLSLHGCDTDAYALARVLIENLTILEFIINFGLFEEAIEEFSQLARKGKKSKRFSYKNAMNKLGAEDRRNKLQGDYSAIGSHFSASRLAKSVYKKENEVHSKIGMALDSQSVSRALGELASIALFAVSVTDQFLHSELAEIGRNFHARRVKLEQEYETLRSVSS